MVLCSIFHRETKNGEYDSIISFAKEYIVVVDACLSNENNDNLIKLSSTIIDCCNTYLALFGYRYIYQHIFERELIKFSFQSFNNYSMILNKYNIANDVQNYYETNFNNLLIEYKNKINNEFVSVCVLKFKSQSSVEIIDYHKKEEEQKINKNVQLKRGDIKNNNIHNNNISKADYFELYNLIENTATISKLSNEYEKLEIYNDYYINSDFNIIILNIEKKK